MHAFARQRVEIDGERRNKRLAFARAHFSNRAFMQHHAANKLHIKMTLAERALSRFTHGRKSWHKQRIQRLACSNLIFELLGARAQLIVAQRSKFGLKRIDCFDFRRVSLQTTVMCRAENLFGEGADQAQNLSI